MRHAIAAAVVWLAASTPAVAAADRVLVIPFENVTRESRIFWLGEASAVILADDLNTLGAEALAREERRAAFERLQLPPSAALTDATVIRIGELVGASHVIVGTLRLESDQLVARARVIALEAGRIAHDVTERGPVADLFSIFERLARRIGPSPAAGAAPVVLPHPPVAAFENYVKGLIAESPATSITYLNAALQLDPQLARARLALWESYSAQGQHDRALAALKGIPAESPWATRARFRSGLSQIQLSRLDEAFSTFRALADEHPDPRLMNNLGVVQLRRAAAAAQGKPTYFFNSAVEADPNESDYFFNLGYAYWLDRDPGAAMYWLREAVRRDPADGDAHFVLGSALAATGNSAQAARERELARRLSSTYEEWEKRPADEVLKGLERLKSDVELPHAETVSALASDQRDQRELARFYLERGRRLFLEERDTDALSELNRTLFLSPYEAEAHLLVGRIHLRGGRTHEAIDALKISLWSADSSEAHLALAEAYLQAREIAAAHDEAQRALALDPTSKAAQAVLEKTVP